MKDFKTINKKEDINVYPIKEIRYNISGNILYMTSCVKNKTFILTDSDYLYVIEKDKKNGMNQYLLRPDKKDKEKKYQTKETESQIWCHKLGCHAIIKYKNDTYYYNPNLLRDKVQELDLYYNNVNLQPYSVAFDDDFYEEGNTGKILFSDYDSNIYKLQITIYEQTVSRVLGFLFSFTPPKTTDDEEIDDDIEDFNYFKLDKNDRILDMKLISSSKFSMYNVNKGNEGKNIFILAITNNILFQFQGKDSFENVFSNYSIKNGDILKATKKFLGNPRSSNLKLSRIQLINQYLQSSKDDEEKKEKRGILFGFMSKCGYLVGKITNVLNPEPQKSFTVFEYLYPKKIENEKQRGLITNIKIVCQSINHIFFLYKDCLVILNKLTNRIVHVKYLDEQYLDMYYDEVLNGIILYSATSVYQMSLEQEIRYLWTDYIEIGNYELALKTLTQKDKDMRPKLHKLYAQHLFNKKRYLESATEYACSDEIFEQVCLKFLEINNNKALIRYLALINYFRIRGKNDSKDKNFTEKYLINTWLLELLIGKYENAVKNGLTPRIKAFTRDSRHGNDFIDLRLSYFILNVYGRDEELVEFAAIKQDFPTIILSLINHKKFSDALKYIETFASYGVENINATFKKLFYNYAALFMKKNPKETISIMENYYKVNKTQEEIIRILMSSDIKNIPGNDEEYNSIITYIKKLMNKPIKTEQIEMNFTKNKNLHNLYILLLSYSMKENYKNDLITYLKKPMTSHYLNDDFYNSPNISQKIYFDLHFAKKILKDNPVALSLICFLLGQYKESIEIALNNDLKDISNLIATNIFEPKLKKQIWLKIFDYRKKEGFLEAKKIVNESKGFIKIEDVLPLMGDNVKINEFKDELKDCIKTYEKSVDLLNKEINEFNNSSKHIQEDIHKAKKKAISVSFSDIRCHQCGQSIKGNRFFMFPCKHIFDADCLIKTYIEFNKQGMGDELFKQKVREIQNMVNKIKSLLEKKKKAKEGGESESSRRLLHIRGEIKALLKLDNTQKEQLTEGEELQLNFLNKGLYEFLDEECLLCGKEVIKGTQIPFEKQNSLEWDIF